MKAGTKVTVTFIRPEGDAKEAATIARMTKHMLPMPAGYMPVRFKADGALLLVHLSYIAQEL